MQNKRHMTDSAACEEIAALEAERDTFKAECVNLNNILDQIRIERDALRAQVEAMREAALELRRFAGCNDVHHDRADQHEYDEPCKVLARIDAVLQEPKP